MAKLTDPAEQGRRLADAGLALQLMWAQTLADALVEALNSAEGHADAGTANAIRQHAKAVGGISLAVGNIAGEIPERASIFRKVRGTDISVRLPDPETIEAIAEAKKREAETDAEPEPVDHNQAARISATKAGA